MACARRSSGRTEAIVCGVEGELTHWLGKVAVVLNPAPVPWACHGGRGGHQVEPSPHVLVWWIKNDMWYVVSSSAHTFLLSRSVYRHTTPPLWQVRTSQLHTLRPNMIPLDPATCATLETPPPTDPDFCASQDSDLALRLQSLSEIGPQAPPRSARVQCLGHERSIPPPWVLTAI
jgi:hypothetical protein